MCTACQWAPHFAAFGRNSSAGRQKAPPTRRSVLRAAAVTTGVVAMATACGTGSQAPVAPASTTAGADRAPDTVFHNGRVYTLATDQPWAEAVAVTGTTISYVGDSAGATALAGPNTTVIDLGGKLLMPGFVEGHTHPFLGSFLTSGVDLQVPTRQDALDAIAAYAKDNPEGPVRGFGWRVDMFGPEDPPAPTWTGCSPIVPASSSRSTGTACGPTARLSNWPA